APTKIGAGGGTDVFVAKVALGVSGLMRVDKLYFLGGSGDDMGRSIIVDDAANPNVYVTGTTTASKRMGTQPFPTTQGAFRRTPVGGVDAFVLKLDPSKANALVYSTLFGGAGDDDAYHIALDPNDNSAYVVGATTSPADPGFKDERNANLKPLVLGTSGGRDGWVARFDPNGNPNPRQGKYFAYIGGKQFDEARSVALVNGGKGNIRLCVVG